MGEKKRRLYEREGKLLQQLNRIMGNKRDREREGAFQTGSGAKRERERLIHELDRK